jgi:periplasmic copper chaperone A
MKWFVVFAAALAGSAQAHVVFAPAEAVAGSYYAGEFPIGHGCTGAATTAVRIEVPEGILTARPRPKPGWTIKIERAPLATPVVSDGEEQRDRVAAITWRGNLPAEQFDGFGVMLKLPKGQSGPIYLPVRQTCGAETVAWVEIPAAGQSWGSLKHPAPVLSVKAAAGHGH